MHFEFSASQHIDLIRIETDPVHVTPIIAQTDQVCEVVDEWLALVGKRKKNKHENQMAMMKSLPKVHVPGVR